MAQSVFKIGSKKIGSESLFFIVEEGQAHGGDFNKAISMVDAAGTTGADAIEFQLARASDFYVKHDPGYQVYLKREFTNSEINDLVAYTKSKGIEFIAVPLSHKLIDALAKAGCSGFNINASDLMNPDIIDAVVDSGVPFFLSVLMATEEEIDWAINRIRKKGGANYALLNGQHIMACMIDEQHEIIGSGKGVDIEHTLLGCISMLKERYQAPVGYIDHTPLRWIPAAAVAAGADTVSKHMVLSRNDKGPDWHICLEPEEMKEAVDWAKAMRKGMRRDSERLIPGEVGQERVIMRRSIVAARRLKSGEIIKREDLLFKRPGTGLCPSRFAEIVGKQVLREIQIDEQIKLSDVES